MPRRRSTMRGGRGLQPLSPNTLASPDLFSSVAAFQSGSGCPYNYGGVPGAAGKLTTYPYVPLQSGGTGCASAKPLIDGLRGVSAGPGDWTASRSGCSIGPRPLGLDAGGHASQSGGRKHTRKHARKHTHKHTHKHRRRFHKGTKSKTHKGKDFETRKSSKRYRAERWMRGRKTRRSPIFPFVGGQRGGGLTADQMVEVAQKSAEPCMDHGMSLLCQMQTSEPSPHDVPGEEGEEDWGDWDTPAGEGDTVSALPSKSKSIRGSSMVSWAASSSGVKGLGVGAARSGMPGMTSRGPQSSGVKGLGVKPGSRDIHGMTSQGAPSSVARGLGVGAASVGQHGMTSQGAPSSVARGPGVGDLSLASKGEDVIPDSKPSHTSSAKHLTPQEQWAASPEKTKKPHRPVEQAPRDDHPPRRTGFETELALQEAQQSSVTTVPKGKKKPGFEDWQPGYYAARAKGPQAVEKALQQMKAATGPGEWTHPEIQGFEELAKKDARVREAGKFALPEDSGDEDEPERRMGEDGVYYTKKDFLEWYKDEQLWKDAGEQGWVEKVRGWLGDAKDREADAAAVDQGWEDAAKKEDSYEEERRNILEKGKAVLGAAGDEDDRWYEMKALNERYGLNKREPDWILKGGRKRTHKRRRARRRTRRHTRYHHPKKGQRSRTRKGLHDFTTKKSSHVFNRRRHYQRKSRKGVRRRPYRGRH